MLLTEKSVEARAKNKLDASLDDKIDNLYDALFPIDTKLNDFINKPSIQAAAIEQEIEKIITASGLDKNKHKEVLAPLISNVIGEICLHKNKLPLLLLADRYPPDQNHPKIDEQDKIFVDINGQKQTYSTVKEIFEKLKSGERDFASTQIELKKVINSDKFQIFAGSQSQGTGVDISSMRNVGPN